MCGIYGTNLAYTSKIIDLKLQRTKFRGPDYTGVKNYELPSGTLVFGHNRLSIIDLDARSNQPFDYQDRCSIVFNGEVFNFKEIRKELQAKGYEFKTDSDTEVVCASYLEWKEKCLDKFIGMFALVIYDHERQTLFGGRDRLGQKPLYYQLSDQGFEFASQLSSIQVENSKLTISKDSISKYLAWGKIPDPDSIFNEIKKIRPGYFFVYDLKNKSFTTEKYWDISHEANTYTGTYEQAKQELEKELTAAVERRLYADVPIGVFLSGGVDSSLIAALAAKSSKEKIRTFSIKFTEQGFDESSYAQMVAEHLGTIHETIECSVDEGLGLIEEMAHFYDEPFADSSAIPSMLLAKYTSKHVTVALSGDGGDESFLGYSRYHWILNANKAYQFPSFLRSLGGSVLQMLPKYRLKLIGKGLKEPSIEDFYIYSMAGLDNSWLRNSDAKDKFEGLEYLKNDLPLVQRMADFDIKTYLNWDINTKVDRATMAFALEARSPFLDHKIVELARSLPVDYKIKGSNQKRILKDILYTYVPEHIFDRPKSGFTLPLKHWFREDLKDYVLETLSETELKKIPGIVQEDVTKMIGEHMDGSWNRTSQIWKLIVLKQWLDKNRSGYSLA